MSVYGYGYGFGFGFGFAGGGLCVSPWVSALAVRPTIPMVAPPVNPLPFIGPSVSGVANNAIAKFQAVRREPNGTLTGVTGDQILSGDGIIGISVADYLPGQIATAAKTGATVYGTGLTPGPLFRNAAGLPVNQSLLPVPVFPAVAYTNQVGVGSSAGLDVQIFPQIPVT